MNTPRADRGQARPRRVPSRFRAWLTPGRAFLLGLALLPLAMFALEHSRVPDVMVRPLMTSNTEGQAHAIVVPAAGLTSFCTLNAYSLRRVVLGIRAYRQGRAPVILFSGGTPQGLTCSVADVMADLARSLGVPTDAIRVERTSRTTWENALHSAPLLWGIKAERILLVTDRLHMRRAEASFRGFGFEVERLSIPVPEAEPGNISMLRMAFREYVALAYYRVQGRVAGGALQAPARHPGSGAMNNIRYPDGPVVILGASYAGGWKPPTLAGRPVHVRGISGQQSFEVLGRFPGDVLAAGPRAVILWGFINDIFRAPRNDVDRAVSRARASFEEMVATARREGIEPVVATEVTVRPPKSMTESLAALAGRLLGRESYQDYINGHVRQTNAWLRDWAEREGLLLLDFERVLSDSSGRRRKEYATEDGSHISAAGYAALTAYAAPILGEGFARP